MPPENPHPNDPQGSKLASSQLISFIQELSFQETYQSVLNCTAVWLKRLVPGEGASLTFPIAMTGSWAIGGPKDLKVVQLEGEVAQCAERSLPIAGSRVGEAFLTEKMAGSDDLTGETAVDLVMLREQGIKSTRCAPLVAGGKVIGTINVGRNTAHGFSERDERVLQEAATVIATQCLLHQRLAEAKESAAHEAENSRIISLLQRLQLKLAHLPNEDEVCRTTAHYLKRIFRLDQASLALLDADGDSITIRALTQRKANDATDFTVTVPVKGSVFERSITHKRVASWNSNDGTEDEAQGALSYALMGLVSGITAPLSSGNQVLGTLNLASADASVFTPSNVTQITEVGRIVGTALAGLRAHDSMKQARSEAEAASASKGAFLANVSHELRTPLNGVLGMAQLLQGTQLDEEQLELVGTIKSSGQLLMRVISDVLEVSKIESGATILEAITFEPAATVEKACAMVSPAAQAKGLEIAFECAPNMPAKAIGDPTRLQQIVVNLLSNAVKFTANGGVYVTMALGEKEEDSQVVEIAVRDTGKGIAQDAIERIFIPFQQEEASTTRRFGGTGLGLAICKQFAGLMGGDISATSAEGEGSVFTVRVVFGCAVESNEPESASETAGKDGAPTTDELDEAFVAQAPLRVLVVDDNPVNRRVAQRLLQRLGYLPELAASGQAAIDATLASEFDLVFMDLSMPEIDGFEASAAIQSGLASPPTIVALTADVQESTRERCIEEGMHGLLAKPFTVAGLKEQLLNVHAKRGLVRDAA